MLKGIAASDGVAVAKAYLLVQPDLSFETVTVEDTNAEEARLDAALQASQDELSVIREKAVGTLGEEAAQVFDAHLMVLADPEMISQIKETIRAAKAVFDEEKANLLAEGVAVADNIQVGIMIEIPAAAMLADQFAKEVDFFSIGTNDLIQYTMAADRMNEQVSYLYQPYNPSILRLINNVIKAAHAEGKWAGMCGEMAGDQQAVPLLVGMGLDEFSMSATSVLRTRSLMKKLDTAKMEEYANRALTECSTMEEVLELQKEYVNFD